MASAADLDRVLAISQDEPAAALIKTEEAKASAERSGDAKALAIAGLEAAQALSLTAGKAQDALREAEQAVERFDELRFDAGRGAALAAMARICAAHGAGEEDAELALDSAQDALRLFRKAGIKKGEALALWSSAQAETAFGRPAQAAKIAKEAMTLFKELADGVGEACACMALAEAYIASGELRKASQAAARAAAVQVGMRNKSQEASCLRVLADIEVRAQRREEALAALSKARTLYQELKDRKGEAAVLASKQEAQLTEGRLAEALDAAKEAVSVFHEAGDRSGEGRALLRVSELLLSGDDVARAAKVAEVAMGILAEAQDSEGMVKGMEMLGAAKHSAVRLEMEESIAANADFMHVPKHLVVDPGFNKRLQDSFREAGRANLL